MIQEDKKPTGRVKCADACAETNTDACNGACGDVTAGESVSAPTHVCESCLLYTSPSPRDRTRSRMPSSA